MVPTIMADDTYIVDLQVEKGTSVIPLNEVEILITTVQTIANVT
jgi:hypothetical protein